MSSDIIEQKNTTILKLTLILDKLFIVLEDFRQNLNDFQNSCKCIENFKNRLNFCELELNYKTIINEYNQNKPEIDEESDQSSDDSSSESINGRSPTTPAKSGIDEEFCVNTDLRESTTGLSSADPQSAKSCFECGYEGCDYRTSLQNKFKKHIKDIHLNRLRIECRVCQFRCWNKYGLKEHMKSCHSDLVESHSCPFNDCQFTCLETARLKDHMKSFHSGSRQWIACSFDDCHYITANEDNLKKHINYNHEGKEKLWCSVDNCLFKCWGVVQLREHKKDCHPEIFEWYTCPFKDCDYKGSNQKNVRQHVLNVHKDKEKISCFKCQFKCWGIKKFQTHLSLVHNTSMQSRRHTPLSVNRKASNRRPVLSKKHFFYDENTKQYSSFKCSECEHSYRTERQLTFHYKWFHSTVNGIKKDKKLFRCLTCGFFDNRKWLMDDHVRSYHGKIGSIRARSYPKWTCSSCAMQFFSAGLLRQHMIEIHKQYIGFYGMRSLCGTAHNNSPTSIHTNANNSSDVIEFNDSVFESVVVKPLISVTEDEPNPHFGLKSDDNFVFGSNLFNHLRHPKNHKPDDITADDCQILSNTPYGCNTNESNKKLITKMSGVLEDHTQLMRCETCSQRFNSSTELMAHQSTVCFSLNFFICGQNFCSFECKDKKALEEHQRTHCLEPESVVIEPIQTSTTEDIVIQSKQNQSQQMAVNTSKSLSSDQNSPQFVLLSAIGNQEISDSVPNFANTCRINGPKKPNIDIKSESKDLEQLPQESNDRSLKKQTAEDINELVAKQTTDGLDSMIKEEVESEDKGMGQLSIEQFLESHQNSTKVSESEPKTDESSDSLHSSQSIDKNKCLFYESSVDYIKLKVESQESEPLFTEQVIDLNNDSVTEQIPISFYGPLRPTDNRNSDEVQGTSLPLAFCEDRLSRRRPGSVSLPKMKGKTRYYCYKCDYSRYGSQKKCLHYHMKSVHGIHFCPICHTIWMSSKALDRHKMSAHQLLVENVFKCEANECGFECNDSNEFNEHKRQHLTQNIDKIISEFQSGIKRVEIKTEIQEQNSDFFNATEFLSQNSGHNRPNSGKPHESELKLSENLNERQVNICPKEQVVRFATVSGTDRRIRGLNSAREPIRLGTKSTKKISELFKK